MTLLVYMTCICLSINAQTVQDGFVKEYNERMQKTPLSEVEIVITNASSTVSDGKGNFVLQFRTLKPGDKVNVRRIEKLGYEIFNKEALDQWFISRDNRPFTIVMCKSDRFKRIRDTYSRVSSKSYEKQLKKEEARLAAERRNGKLKEEEYARALKKLNEDYDRQLDNLDNYVDRFARIDLSELSVTEAEIIELVQHGEIEKAIQLYEQQDLEVKYRQQVTVGQKAALAIDTLKAIRNQSLISRDSLFASIKRKNETLRLAGGQENYEKIRQSLKEIATADTTYYDAIYEYAEFANSQNMFEEALKYYTMCLGIVDVNTVKCILYEKIGNLQLKQNHFHQAETALISSMDIAQYLWSQDSTNYRPYSAQVHNSLAHLYAKMRNYNEADKYYASALRNYSVLFDNRYDMLENIAEVQVDMCEMYMDMRKFENADKLVELAEKNATILYNALPDKYRPLMARVKTSEGRNHRYFLRYHEAETSFKKSEELYSLMFKNNPSAYRPQLADIYGKISDIYALSHQFEKSKKYGTMALLHYDTLVTYSTDAYLPEISNIRNEQAQLCHKMRRYSDMRQYAEDGYKIIKKLYIAYPDVYRYSYCNLTMDMGICSAVVNDLQEAEKYFMESYRLADTLCMIYPDAYLPTYLSTTKNLGGLYSMWHQYDKDSLYTTQAMKICDILYERSPKVYKKEMASMLYNYAVCYLKMGKNQEADTIIRKSELLYNELMENYPEIYLEDYRRVISVISSIQGNMGNKKEEEKYILLAYEKAMKLFNDKPDVYLEDYTRCLNDLAFFYQKNDEFNKSRTIYQEGLALVRKLYNNYPKAYSPQMEAMLHSWALLCWQIKDYTTAWESMTEATLICENLYKENPSRYSYELGHCYSMKGAIQYYGFNDGKKAELNYLKALPFLYAVLKKEKALKKQILKVRRTLTDIYSHSGKIDEALKQIEAILEINPDDEEVKAKKKELEKIRIKGKN